jgi:hypothetical protein
LSLTVERKALPEFEAFLAAEGQAFLERIDDWLASRQVDNTGSTPMQAIRLGVGIYEILDAERRPSKSRAVEQ